MDGRSKAIALFIALIFHQALEAIGLGSVLVKAGFPLAKSIFMVLSYAVTTPIGVAIGIAISATYDGDSITTNAVQGVFDSVAAGLLLYISLVRALGTSQSLYLYVHVPLHTCLCILIIAAVLLSVYISLLLYISQVQFIAEDFTRVEEDRPKGLSFRLVWYSALFVGAGCMAMLAYWA